MSLFPDAGITPLNELTPGEEGEFFVLLVSKDRGTTRDGKPYYRLSWRDSERTVAAMVWQDSPTFAACDQEWQPGQFFRVIARYEETKYGPQIDLKQVRLATDEDRDQGFDPTAFLAATRFDTTQLFGTLIELAETHIDDAPLQKLVVGMLTDHREELLKHPAAARNHHAFVGGFLEHVVSVTRTALYLAEKYSDHYPDMKPTLSKGLIIAGAILHDIGKLQELRTTAAGAEYTPAGKLIGHILLGRDMVRDYAANVKDFDEETLLRLEHIIISHQNLPEWGSPIAPHTPEALLVHYADEIDAKFQMVATALEAEPAAGGEEFTPRDNALRRGIFRGLLKE
ncbi:3'-5' exoribonuclease YhaM family protein [Calycomorphotria hydatis]|uniref:3'-5' exoribonuclease YhaM n=1 Tax=Calycomorphotria hydatis TaxID=2528027 RepID=A0A517TDJ2_9PLAN|nr:HD domain-containing protein [Calycomorphotria hydatis]QDT66446.1 3'-5' exoribonuclease YhaM [Calycomorphotria hydatis]